MKGTLDSISDNLLLFRPLSYMMLMKGSGRTKGKRASYLEAPILCMLCKEGPMPISAIGKRLYVSKPNMTGLIDRMIEEGYVSRMQDAKDRRIARIAITEDGRKYMSVSKRTVKANIQDNLSSLGPDELNTLSDSLRNINRIIAGMNKET
ncbi:MAG: MarR family transcriptional regulator [Candidatus Altiarchaeota archaeon]